MRKYQLDDLVAFMRWAKENNKSDSFILMQIAHDLVGLSEGDPVKTGFLPRTTGFVNKHGM